MLQKTADMKCCERQYVWEEHFVRQTANGSLILLKLKCELKAEILLHSISLQAISLHSTGHQRPLSRASAEL